LGGSGEGPEVSGVVGRQLPFQCRRDGGAKEEMKTLVSWTGRERDRRIGAERVVVIRQGLSRGGDVETVGIEIGDGT